MDSLTGNGPKTLMGHAAASLDVLLSGKTAKETPASDTKITHPKSTAPKSIIKDVKIPTLVRFSGKQFRTMVIQI